MEWIVQVLKPMIVTKNFAPGRKRGSNRNCGKLMGGLNGLFAVGAIIQSFPKLLAVPSVLSVTGDFQRFENRSLDPDTRIYWSFGSKELFSLQWVEAEMLLAEYNGLGTTRAESEKSAKLLKKRAAQ